MLLAQSSAQGIIILAIAGIPEIIYHRRLVHRHTGAPGASRQALFFTFTAPPWDLFFAVGIALAGLHAQGVLSLSATGRWSRSPPPCRWPAEAGPSARPE